MTCGSCRKKNVSSSVRMCDAVDVGVGHQDDAVVAELADVEHRLVPRGSRLAMADVSVAVAVRDGRSAAVSRSVGLGLAVAGLLAVGPLATRIASRARRSRNRAR